MSIFGDIKDYRKYKSYFGDRKYKSYNSHYAGGSHNHNSHHYSGNYAYDYYHSDNKFINHYPNQPINQITFKLKNQDIIVDVAPEIFQFLFANGHVGVHRNLNNIINNNDNNILVTFTSDIDSIIKDLERLLEDFPILTEQAIEELRIEFSQPANVTTNVT